VKSLARSFRPSRVNLGWMVKYWVWYGRWATAIVMLLGLAGVTAASQHDASSDDLKARVASTPVGDRPKLCLQIAEKQLDAADKLYAADDVEKAQATLTDVTAYTELARDYAIQAHKHEKQTEIAVRAMTRKLNDILRSLGREDQGAVREALTRLQRVRDDLLAAMFPKGTR
jgi:hypothetical protein